MKMLVIVLIAWWGLAWVWPGSNDRPAICDTDAAFTDAGVVACFQNRTPIRCTEDMSCWNCETMGNLICGRPK